MCVELMKGMKTVKYEELSEEQMMAARQRRQREVSRCVAGATNNGSGKGKARGLHRWWWWW